MSVIAAKVTDSYISLASDSIMIKGEQKRIGEFRKLRCVQPGLICGGCGDVEELTLFFAFMNEHKPTSTTIKAVTDLLNDFRQYKFIYTNNDVINNCYLIAFNNYLYESDGMFVREVTTYTAIGEGEDFALAALHLGHSAEEAVKVACDLCVSVAEPIVKFKMEF